MDFNEMVTDNIAEMAAMTLKQIEGFGPKDDLTRKRYTGMLKDGSIDKEMPFIVAKHGPNRALQFLKKNMARDMEG